MLFGSDESIVVNGLRLLRITVKTQSNLDSYFLGVKNRINKMSVSFVQSGLLFGLNNYYCVLDGYLCLFHYYRDKLSLVTIPFKGDMKFMHLSEVLKLMKKYNIYRIRFVLNTYFVGAWNSVLSKYFKVNRICDEYIYDNFALAGLEGKEWKNLRNKVHKFRNRYSDRIEIMPFDKTLMSSALACYDVWYETAGQKIVNSGEQIWDRKFFEICLHYYEELGIDMFLAKDNAEQKFIGCVAYTILADDFAYGIFRKLSSEYDYFSQYMQFYQADILSREYGIQYLNDAYDGGKEGLRALKMGFKPVKTLKFVSLSVRKEKQK